MRRVARRETGPPSSGGSPDACESRWRTVAPGGPAGSSRSRIPSSAAISVAYAVTSFVTEAHAKLRAASPRVTGAPRPETSPTATFAAGHASPSRSASTARDTSPVERQVVPAQSAFAASVGYARAVRVGPYVAVAGTAPVMPDDAAPPADAYGQARRCLEILTAALAEVGAAPEHVIRTRIFVTDPGHIVEVGRAHL